MKLKKLFVSIVCMCSCCTVFGQNVKLSTLFSDGCVLQQKSKVPVWGTADPGEAVVVSGSWNDEQVKVTADETGKWIAYLSTPAGGASSYTLNVNDEKVENVLVGEVWICSGQSNMKFRLGESWDDNWQIKGDNFTDLRFFEVGVKRSDKPLDDVEGFWRYGKYDNNMQHISAVGYYFGRYLRQKLNVPVGVIGIYEGGTSAEEWTEKALFDSCEELKGTYHEAQPVGCLYNGMVAPVLPYKNSGIIWYQGENNVSRQNSYKTLLELMVEGWRNDFDDPTLPFYIAQLTSYGNDDWRTFREIQADIAGDLRNSGLAVTIDGGEESNIHPHKKKIVGDRLAMIALGRVYGMDEPVSSPVFRKKKIEGNRLRLYFKYADSGFKVSGDDADIKHFELCGDDGVYHAAHAVVEGNTILLDCPEVKEPKEARYFWNRYGEPNIFTAQGLPIVPFRTEK